MPATALKGVGEHVEECCPLPQHVEVRVQGQVGSGYFHSQWCICLKKKIIQNLRMSAFDTFTVKQQIAPDNRSDRYFMFYSQSTAKGHIKAKQKYIATTSKILIHYVQHIPLLRS